MNFEPGAVIEYHGNVPPQLILPPAVAEARQQEAAEAAAALQNAVVERYLASFVHVTAPVGSLGRVTQAEATEEFFGPDQPAWYEATLPWERPPRWRLLASWTWRRRHERILALERKLGVTTRPYSVLPWMGER